MDADYIYNRPEIHCTNEYGKLEKVLVCPPAFMEIKEIINETQKYYASKDIDRLLAQKQHAHFVRTLRENGTEVIEIPMRPHLPEQVFTRDIGFTIGKNLFLSCMAESVRKEEVVELEKILRNEGIYYKSPFRHAIEGGDVIVDEEIVWVGISGRTTRQAVDSLKRLLPFHQIECLNLDNDILHLDCAFNLIDSSWALVYRNAFLPEDFKKLKKRYNLIEVDSDEQFTMGTNTLALGDGQILTLPENIEVNRKMAEYGFDIIEIDFSEIIKSGGSFRCCSLPLWRK